MTDILETVENYLSSEGVKPSAFGRDILGDPKFVFELREGREPRRKTVQKIMEHISAERTASRPPKGAA